MRATLCPCPLTFPAARVSRRQARARGVLRLPIGSLCLPHGELAQHAEQDPGCDENYPMVVAH